MICLATAFTANNKINDIIPRGGVCDTCSQWTSWGDIVKGSDRRKYGGAAATEEEVVNEEEEEYMDIDQDSVSQMTHDSRNLLTPPFRM
jgi:hypothetical protein